MQQGRNMLQGRNMQQGRYVQQGQNVQQGRKVQQQGQNMQQGRKLLQSWQPQQKKQLNVKSSQQHPLDKGMLSKMPQKFRIAINCSKLKTKSICTDVKQIKGNHHLVICARSKDGNRDFRRQFLLPKQCHHDKQVNYLKSGNIFVVEFPLLEMPKIDDIRVKPEIIKSGRDKLVTLNLTIPETVDPAKVEVCVKERFLIIRLEDKPLFCGTESCSRVFFYNRITLPVDIDVSLIKCVQKKRKLRITVPLINKRMGGFRRIVIRRKLRQRKTRKTTATSLQQKQKLTSPLKKMTSGVTLTKHQQTTVPKIKQTVGDDKLKKKKKSPLTGVGIGINKNIVGGKDKNISDKGTTDKSKLLTQTPLTKKKSLPKIASDKKIGDVTPTSTSPTQTQGKKSKLGARKGSGTEVLQQIFGSASKSSDDTSGRKSSIPNLQQDQSPR